MATVATGGKISIYGKGLNFSVYTKVVFCMISIIFLTISFIWFMNAITWDQENVGYTHQNIRFFLSYGTIFLLLGMMPIILLFIKRETLLGLTMLGSVSAIVGIGLFSGIMTTIQPSFGQWATERYGISIQETGAEYTDGDLIPSLDGEHLYTVHENKDNGSLFLYNGTDTKELKLASKQTNEK